MSWSLGKTATVAAASRRASARRLTSSPGPVSRFRGCTSTFDVGMAASCGRASERCPIHDRERPLPPHERRDAREGRLEERAVADDAAVLLGDGRAGDQPGERLEPGAIAPGEHEGPETVG